MRNDQVFKIIAFALAAALQETSYGRIKKRRKKQRPAPVVSTKKVQSEEFTDYVVISSKPLKHA